MTTQEMLNKLERERKATTINEQALGASLYEMKLRRKEFKHHAGVTVSSSTKYQIEQLSFYAHELFGECLTYDDIVTLMIHYFYVGLGLREKPTGDVDDTFI